MLNNQISVIIATLGRYNMSTLVRTLGDSNIIKKIYISVPSNAIKPQLKFNCKKVQIVSNPYRHQVLQRLAPLNLIDTKYILYLDDDVYFNKYFLFNLVREKILKGNNSVIGPVYYDKKKNKIHSNNLTFRSFLKKIYHFFLFFTTMTSKRMGKVSDAGTCYGVDPDFINSSNTEVDWLPGGCILINKNKMVKKNYFKSFGKAFCEDLILSFLLKQKGIKIFITKNCKLYTDAPQALKSKKDYTYYLNGLQNLFDIKKEKTFNYYIWRKILFIRKKLI